MGENDAKTEDPKKPDAVPAGEENKNDTAVVIILKLNLHCDGCAKKLNRSIRNNFQGVDEVMTDLENNKLTVKGRVDPANLIQKLEMKTRRKIELLSPLPTTAGAGDGNGNDDDKKLDDKTEKKPEQSETNKEVEEKPKEITVVLKIRLHCEDCMHKIKRVIKKYDGVKSVDFEAVKNLVKVVGVIDVNSLVSYLKDKLKRSVEIIPNKKDGHDEKIVQKEASGEEEEEEKGGAKVDAKEKAKVIETSDREGDKKEKESDTNNGKGVASVEEKAVRVDEAKVETNKMEYYGQTDNSYYTMPPPMPINHVYINHGHNYGYGMPSDQSQGSYNSDPGFVNYPHQGNYHNEGYYNLQQYPQSPGPYDAFSDENPNASCYVM
ncbi:heavy metal-associated isoprenylated plant protein 3-like [Impatiens glandulifera]|uniref:heavy metal-associated isoprenylated plant protein 3-like n=1 Tax=Impatiens glandulifera TaxID=253017 RepID=UPI001FB0E7B0|nr:heavy metal-associated isoprenylated plant protein 3-like [Impatiens glandulifera]